MKYAFLTAALGVVLSIPHPANAQYSLQASASASAGSNIDVNWNGTSGERDFITIVAKGTPDRKYSAYQYSSRGNPVTLAVPEEAGEYEIRLLKGDTYATLASRPLTVTKVTATLKAPASVDAGAEISIEWTGPNNARDFITIVPAGTPERKYNAYVYAERGSPAKLRAPDDAGPYEIRYLTGGGYATLASVPITIGKTSATLQVPPQVEAGANMEIQWTGPDNPRDFITIVEAGAKEGTYNTYVYTARGRPAKMRAPDKPGKYEARYATGQKYSTLVMAPFTVGATTASLQAADEVKGGEPFPVTWEGPNHRGDFITIVPAGTTERRYGNYAYTHRGKTVTLTAPLKEGNYELRYATGQSYSTLASRPIRVGPPSAQPGFLRVVGSTSGSISLPAGNAVELILDASGSMLQRQGGQRRIDIAKQVLTQLTRETLPAGTPFALRVFGHKEADSCRTDLEVPLRPLDGAAAASLIGGIEAKNLAKTPIADSLALVAKDLGAAKGQRLVILITDGEETCGGDPAEAIEKLKAAGIDVRVNIVGFAIDNDDLKQTFRYWANAGGGSYFDATSAAELSASLTGALRVPYDVENSAGQLVANGLTGGDPVQLPAGTYRVKTRSNPPQILEGVEVPPGDTKIVSLGNR